MNIDERLKLILKFGEGAPFLSFANADGKRWLMPARHMRTAMNLYQPSGAKGKLVKRYLPWLYWNPVALRVLRAERMRLSLSDEFRLLLEHTFGERDLEFAVFCGTPSVHQKITIQISKRNKILGYCKISHNQDVYETFQQESRTLTTLNNLHILYIPHSLFCKTFGNIYIFIQSTQKTNKSKTIHKWTNYHEEYINILYKKTKINIDFQQTDFYSELNYLEFISNTQYVNDKHLFQYAIDILKKHYSNITEYSFFHGDFTPWNMFLDKGHLCVFDFEYAQFSFPPFLDKIHFLLQVWIIEQKLNSEQIFILLENIREKEHINLIQIIAYLTHILSFYIRLYNGKFRTNDNGYIIWSQLLKKYIIIYG